MSITRIEMLCLLKPLVPDVQRKIFGLIFPTLDESHKLIEKLCINPQDWQPFISVLASFVHSDDRKLDLQLQAADAKLANYCCKHLQIGLAPIPATRSVGSTMKWPQKVVLSKPANWCMGLDISDSLRAFHDPKLLACAHCGAPYTEFDDYSGKHICSECWDFEKRSDSYLYDWYAFCLLQLVIGKLLENIEMTPSLTNKCHSADRMKRCV